MLLLFHSGTYYIALQEGNVLHQRLLCIVRKRGRRCTAALTGCARSTGIWRPRQFILRMGNCGVRKRENEGLEG